MHSLILKFDGGFLACFSWSYKALDNGSKRDLPSYLCPSLFFSTTSKYVLKGGDCTGTSVSIGLA